MTPTNEQIIAEAERRWALAPSRPSRRGSVQDYIIEVMREGWTPPEPVYPDLLAFREWLMEHEPGIRKLPFDREWWDNCLSARAYLAGARMAREQEQERANHPIAFAVRVMAGVFKDLDHAKREARATLAKYRGEA